MINDNNCQMLIGAGGYLIEPELIYSVGNRTDYDSIGILFYPDTTMTPPFNIKLARFLWIKLELKQRRSLLVVLN